MVVEASPPIPRKKHSEVNSFNREFTRILIKYVQRETLQTLDIYDLRSKWQSLEKIETI